MWPISAWTTGASGAPACRATCRRNRAPPAPPDARLAAEERDRAIRAALDQLPDRQRMAVVLRYYEDLSLGEIAESMDATYKAVERLLARARASLESRPAGIPRRMSRPEGDDPA